MQKRAGLLYISKSTGRILLILENSKWTIPTFSRNLNLISDAEIILNTYSNGKILPVELYSSEDKQFEYGTYVCLVDCEFIVPNGTFCWVDMENIPHKVHSGLLNTLNNNIIQEKIKTVLSL
jgi:hypothetical protein